MIRIYRDAGGDLNPDDYEIAAVYDPDREEWIDDQPGLAEYYPPGTPPEMLLEQLDGPSYIAVDETDEAAADGATQATLTDVGGDAS